MRRATLLLLLLTGASAALAQEASGLLRLAGIVVAPGARFAIFEATPGQAAAVAERIGEYTVRLIHPDRVQVDGKGESLTVAPTPLGAAARAMPADTGGATFGLVVNPPAPAPD